MKIISYKYSDAEVGGWDFDKVRFRKLNLLVGATGSGKTRFLNSFFNVACFVTGKQPLGPGNWEIEFVHDKKHYQWNISAVLDEEMGVSVVKENLWQITKKKNRISIIKRSGDSFILKNKKEKLPKLPRSQLSLSILRRENLINPIHQGFRSILRRYFSEDQLSKAVKIDFLANELIDKIDKEKNLALLAPGEMGLSARLWLLKNSFSEIFSKIENYYIEVFPFIKRIRFVKKVGFDKRGPLRGIFPIFSINERNVSKWLNLDELSSGMQKVLLILTDICSIPEGSIYLIDEYENSLGINAIDFFPDFLSEFETDIQILITSHHPYIINNIHPRDWFVLHRKGSDVKIKFGDEVVERLGSSRQKSFFKLMNDPFYTEGIE